VHYSTGPNRQVKSFSLDYLRKSSPQVVANSDCRKLTPSILSSHDLNWPEAKRFRVKLTDLNISKIDLVKVFIDLLEAENLKSETSLTNTRLLCQLMSPLLFTLRRTNPYG
jgi:hypothetical protein